MGQIVGYIFEWIENIVRIGQSAGYLHFFLFQQCFQKSSLSELIKLVIVHEVGLKERKHCGKGDKDSYQHLFLYPNAFKNLFFNFMIVEPFHCAANSN